jgi:catechol 2,3-dioxygenase-like lactoylglutathione lyase family enzyme
VGGVRFECANPILRVEEMGRSLRFYVEQLGFRNEEWGEDFTCVTRGPAGIYLCEGDQGRGGAWVWIGVEDARGLHDEFVKAGVNYPWALEFRVEDPDGNVLRFGSEPLPD